KIILSLPDIQNHIVSPYFIGNFGGCSSSCYICSVANNKTGCAPSACSRQGCFLVPFICDRIILPQIPQIGASIQASKCKAIPGRGESRCILSFISCRQGRYSVPCVIGHVISIKV